MKEWKDVVGYEGLYSISSNGEVASLSIRNRMIDRPRLKILKDYSDKDGYYVVTLCKNNHKETYRVHRLVAIAFHNNFDNLPCVNHKDECKTNNNVENLEWCTVKYNSNYNDCAIKRGILQRIPIIQYSKKMELIKIWSGRIEIVKTLGFSGGNITSCCSGNRKYANNYIWRYENEKMKF